jgi:hypothetical protein
MTNKIDKILEELKLKAQFDGKKLAFLIAGLDVDKETTEAFFTILPTLNSDQLTKLIEVLETNYLNQKTKDLDEKLKRDLEKIKKEYDGKEELQDKKTIEELKQIKEDLEKLSS